MRLDVLAMTTRPLQKGREERIFDFAAQPDSRRPSLGEVYRTASGTDRATLWFSSQRRAMRKQVYSPADPGQWATQPLSAGRPDATTTITLYHCRRESEVI